MAILYAVFLRPSGLHKSNVHMKSKNVQSFDKLKVYHAKSN